MSLPLVLALLVLGIALSQAASKARAVTLRWLRLGDLISLSLLGIAAAALLLDAPADGARALTFICAALAAGTMVHLLLVQSGRRSAQRFMIAATSLVVALALILPPLVDSLASMRLIVPARDSADASMSPAWASALVGPAMVLTSWLTGGSLMTMLLGHAYLTSGSEMTQQPFLRLVRLLLAGLVVRLLVALAAGLWPWWIARSSSGEVSSQTMATLMIAARFLMGLVVPLIMTWMALQCVRLRSNQSATGILYVSSTMILVGEFLALSLTGATGLAF